MREDQAKAEFMKLMNTAEGKRLIALLTKDGGAALKGAGDALRQGNETEVKGKLSPMLEQREVQALLQKLNQKMNHG